MQYTIKKLFDFLFSGTTLRRWNGLIHPVELTEVDRQGHKMMIAWFLYMLERPTYTDEEALNVYIEIVEGAFFTYCLNLALTDIKPSIYEQICKNKEHHRAILSWAFERFVPLLTNISPSLAQRAKEYLLSQHETTKARTILKAASLYSRFWEYQLLRDANAFLHTDATIFRSLSDDIELQCEELPSFKQILSPFYTSLPFHTTELRRIASLCGTLRFQQRWSQIVRLPKTNVLGHTFLVSVYSYIFSLLIESCPMRIANTFFGSLFHDLPELVTQDIVNPVKHSSSSVARIIQEYEHQEVEHTIILPLKKEHPILAEGLQYLLGYDVSSEFDNTIIENGIIRTVSFYDLQNKYNTTKYSPKDGTLIKLCDNISALIEAHTSIIQGVRPPELIEARERILQSIIDYSFCKKAEDEQSYQLFIASVGKPVHSLIESITNETSL
ncbi:MAG: HD domain-containing protein [Desulfovibrionaceae bacterium]|nr:HD domain-containing protein [Desulfovibrionaceae bacterium]